MDTKKKKPVVYDNPIEIVRDVANEIVLKPATDLMDEAMRQFGLKEQKAPLFGEIDLSNKKVEQKPVQVRYLQTEGKEIFNAKQKALEKQIGQIMQQLKIEVSKLQMQTAQLTGEVKAITVETIPVRPGAYHLNYFEWVISMLRDLRKKVNESRLWLKMWSKKKQQKGYWAMFKKHGTSFAMSEERAIASANG